MSRFDFHRATGDYFSKLRRLLAKMGPDDQKLLLHMAQKVAKHQKVARR
jgi:hypothetical protein